MDRNPIQSDDPVKNGEAGGIIPDIEKIQSLLRQYSLDVWIFSDFQGRDFISGDFLKLTKRKCTRRMFYFIPVKGEPVKLLSAIEPLLLDHLPGRKVLYKGMREQRRELSKILLPGMQIACQYSPGGNVPTISSMDAGLVEYLKTFEIELISSADLMQFFGAVLTKSQIESHRQAGEAIHRILDQTFYWIRNNLNAGIYIDEWMMLKEMERLIAAEGIYMDSPPFFGIDEHACDPGYEPSEHGSAQIREGSRLIIDIAGRMPGSDSIYYDISWCMNVGPEIDPEYRRLFETVNEVRNRLVAFIEERLNQGKEIRGYEVDELARTLFRQKGLDNFLMHRTGHNIGHSCHGIGANLDDFETHDVRCLLPGTMFSVEPGIYTDKYGVRLEFDVHLTEDRKARIYGPVQTEILVV
ncbi:Xaa-Pro peptidase family protein [uncultured Clostridium sp.]|uniref:M24 family metallopeptidase n=1 Tax=uncultured Clostridium sp. TaxID=59620 RepID=UPI0025CF2105|nr:M24 family metallopeptidase [uncultured Clostridium sp.]